MLFNSYEFILGFLPVTVLLFYIIGGRGRHKLALFWLVLASLFFYGWWNYSYLGLILSSMLANYLLGYWLGKSASPRRRRTILTGGIVFNLGLLGYYKYTNFFVDNIDYLLGTNFHLETIVLPLAISFFTFQQIAYLVDAWRGETHEYRFLHYCLFVTFFPQLIAGPIVHHKEMLPQFAVQKIFVFKPQDFAVGISIFIIGLFKKVILADNLAAYATPVFFAADHHEALTFFAAWGGALAYTFQLYFDFSGYSDMAIGLARLFGIRLPINFDSPYKAVNIIDFWRRWHITLSRFLRDYLYVPLGGKQRGTVRRYENLLITMLLGGLWHGAGWNFVIWGGLHGFYLIVNHGFHGLKNWFGWRGRSGVLGIWCGRLITFLAVVVSWVFFRAETLDGALAMLAGMVGLNGFVLPASYQFLLGPLGAVLAATGWKFVSEINYFWGSSQLLWLVVATFIVWRLPNTQEFFARFAPAVSVPGTPLAERRPGLLWRPTMVAALSVGIMATASLLSLNSVSEFLYFQF